MSNMDELLHLTHFEGKLYRYQPYTGNHIEYVNDLILNNRIYYCSPSRFNDPFDCKMYGIKFADESVEQVIRERTAQCIRQFESYIPVGIKQLTQAQKAALIETTIKNNREKVLEESASVIQELHKIVENEIGVVCFSSDPLNILMYSHYADNHRGICLEFTLQKDNIFNPEPVRYVKDFPMLEFGDSHDVNMMLAVALVATKSIDWRYEQEHRSIRGEGAGTIEIPSDYLSGIIFGCEAENDTVKAITDLVRQSGKVVELYRAVKSNSAFALRLEEIAICIP